MPISKSAAAITGLTATTLVFAITSVALAGWIVGDLREAKFRLEGVDHLATVMHMQLLDLQGCAGEGGQPDFAVCKLVRNGTTGSFCSMSNALEPMRRRHERSHEGRQSGKLPDHQNCHLCKEYPADFSSFKLPPGKEDAHFLDERVCP